MKALEELGISLAPWVRYGDIVEDAEGNVIYNAYDDSDYPNANLIAVAPRMYEELRQEMERRYCVKCKHSVWTKRGGIEIMTGCDGKGACPKPSWKKVLAEASGEDDR